MRYETAHFWRNKDGQIWHSLEGHPNDRLLSMGACHSSGDETLMQMAYKRLLVWAQSHHMTIVDYISPDFVGPIQR